MRPIHHRLDPHLDRRIEVHIFIAFIAYCLHVTLKQRLRALAPGRHIVLPRYTQPDHDQQILLQQLKLTLPPQPPARIAADAAKSV